MIKKLMWLVKHQEEIEKMLTKPKVKKIEEEKAYSIAGVPEFQKEYVKDLLSGKLKDN